MEAALLVARAGAIAILAHSFIAAICGFVLVGPVVTGVATCAVGLICGVLPGDHFRIALVAVRTQEIAAMILWLVRQRSVPVVRGRPRVGAMTCIALYCCVEMVLILTRRLDTIMAGRAGAKHLRMINC